MFNTRKLLTACGGRVDVAPNEAVPPASHAMPPPTVPPFVSDARAPLQSAARPLWQRPAMQTMPSNRSQPFPPPFANSLPFPAADRADLPTENGPVRPYTFPDRNLPRF